jgi:crotonobetainyl-CoA:carnitine CoA-transferase CaiB-like acyl-CoA transferase
MGPLAGLKVIDLTHVMAGPTCTLMLADMGAEVIKIEKAPNGDDSRHMIPPKIGEEAAAFLMMNRNNVALCSISRQKGASKSCGG